ncbi:MAG: translation elongation factor Ts [Anaplasmataceae bacterium]|nr:translation elongation factor Ts [Candidatus Heimdallarchaeota archaeon]MDH5796015.1 translation elongation factor Ts [Anaplasmataceae bacterium]
MDSKQSEILKKLREKTSFPMNKCLNALRESNWNEADAEKLLIASGDKAAIKKSDRETSCGLMAVCGKDNTFTVFHILCETDSVANNEKFIEFARVLSVESASHSEIDEFLDNKMSDGYTVQNFINTKIALFGENIKVINFSKHNNKGDENVVLGCYVHGQKQLASKDGNVYIGTSAVITKLKCTSSLSNYNEEKIGSLIKDISMQALAMQPKYLTVDAISEDDKKTMIETFGDEVDYSKPPAVVEKIIAGKLQKFYKQCVLLEQEFIKNPDIIIKDFIEDFKKENGFTSIDVLEYFYDKL